MSSSESEPNRPLPNRPLPNRPKARSDAQPLITSQQRRRLLGGSFAQQQSLAEAQEYDAVRPRYPQQAVADILALAADPAARRLAHPAAGSPGGLSGGPPQIVDPLIVDLGAGTGILSRALLGSGARVHAVEPSTAMTQILSSTAAIHADRLQITRASAEETGLPSAEADLVVAAQAWHWFDTEAVQTEIARLLVPGGGLALIWNYLDTADPTVHRLTRIMRAGDTYRPGWRPTLDAQRFSPTQTTEYRWTRTLSVAEIFRYATTLSSWLSADDAQRGRRRTNLGDYLHRELGLADDDAIELPQLTALHTARLR